MQFSKRISELARVHGLEPKDVFFAVLATSGIAAVGESFAIVYRPTVSTSAALTTKASNYIGQRPGLKRLIKYLDEQHAEALANSTDNTTADNVTRRRGRPRKDDGLKSVDDKPLLDYTDKDAILKEYADIVVGAEKIGDKLSALNGIATLQRMKQEAKIEDEKRVTYYVPLSYDKCDELLRLLARYYDKNNGGQADSSNLLE